MSEEWAPVVDGSKITTDENGRHWDAEGREYRKVGMVGEPSYQQLTGHVTSAEPTEGSVRQTRFAIGDDGLGRIKRGATCRNCGRAIGQDGEADSMTGEHWRGWRHILGGNVPCWQ